MDCFFFPQAFFSEPYERLEIKKERVQRMGTKMTKYFSRVKGRCGVTNFEDDDDHDLRFLIINELKYL